MSTSVLTGPPQRTVLPGQASQIQPLFRASMRMALRARGVLYVLVASPLMMLVWVLIRDLEWGIGDQRINFLDFVITGTGAFLAAHLFQDIVTAVAASYKSRGILKRLAVTPVSSRLVVGVQLATYTIFGVVNAVLMLAVGKLLGVNIVMTANLLWALLLIAVVVLTALGFAFAIAGFTSNPQAANGLSGALGLPLAFLSGASYPLEALPGPLGDIFIWAIPFAAPIKAIRGIALEGVSITAYGTEALISAGWLVLVFSLAAKGYRFDRE
jgi:ABC-type multidrug transport system permease subunit